jgi:peptide/nickel transport system substrate-binding protein
MIRRYGPWAAVLAVLVSITGCGQSDSSDDDESQEVAQITILSDDIPAGLDYDGPSVPAPSAQEGIVNLVENLVDNSRGEVNEDGVQLLDFENFEGRLAESWDYDPATLTWTFHLRQGVVGCDGATFNADDVIYTFERAKSVTGAIAVSWFEFNVAAVDGFTPDVFDDESKRELGDEVTKVDDYTVKIRQSAPSQLFLPVMATFATGILDKETMEQHKTGDDPWSHKYNDTVNLPGFGPYCLEKWDKGSEFVVKANPKYYRGAPPISRIVYRKVPESANRLAALRSGAAQVAENLTPKQIEAAKQAEGLKVGGIIGNENLFLHMNFKSKPFDDPKVRQAIATLIPYDQIVNDGYFNQAKKWEGHVPSSFPGYVKPTTQYATDPVRAKALLAEAGYPEGRGLDQFGGSFQLTYVAEKESTLGPIATMVQAALRAAGIPAQLNPVPNSQFVDRLFVKKDLPFALDDQEKPVLIDAGYALFNAQISSKAGAPANNTNYSNPRVDELTAAANVETDEAKRAQMLAEAQEILQKDLNWVPIVERKTQWALSERINGLTWHPENALRWFELSAAAS